MCQDEEPGATLKGKTIFDLKHVITGRYLFTDKRYEFTHGNCGQGCPILGQLEISCDRYSTPSTKWKINSVTIVGIF